MREKIKLVAIPCAGASAMMYFDWKKELAEEIELVTVELPGRGLRFKDKHPNTLDELTDDLLTFIEPQIAGCQYAFLGFCFGATVIYDICRKLREKGYPEPKYLFVGSSAAPGVHIKSEKLFELSNFRIVLALLNMFSFNLFRASEEEMLIVKSFIGMINPKVQEELRNMTLLDLIIGFTFRKSAQSKSCQSVLNIVKADGKLMYHYQATGKEVIFTCPVIAIHGDTDNLISLEDMRQWQKNAGAEFELREVKGGHMMVFDNPSEVIAIVNNYISKEKRSNVIEKEMEQRQYTGGSEENHSYDYAAS